MTGNRFPDLRGGMSIKGEKSRGRGSIKNNVDLTLDKRCRNGYY
jgi:hypothetical protein